MLKKCVSECFVDFIVVSSGLAHLVDNSAEAQSSYGMASWTFCLSPLRYRYLHFAVHIFGDGDVCSSQVTSYVLLAAVYVKQTKSPPQNMHSPSPWMEVLFYMNLYEDSFAQALRVICFLVKFLSPSIKHTQYCSLTYIKTKKCWHVHYHISMFSVWHCLPPGSSYAEFKIPAIP